MQHLKQSTSTYIQLGPFLDETNGYTAEGALTITSTDVWLSKNGGTFANPSDTGAASHDRSGWYRKNLNVTDTGTLGRLIVSVHETGALPVWREFMVVPANVYDSMVLGTDYLEVDIEAVSGDETAADNLELDYDGNGYAKANSTIGTVTTNTDLVSATAINAEVDTALSDIHLDHLLAVDYDPTAKPGVATALLNELVENDAGESRFTANALEQAPSGGASAGDIADAVWEELIADHSGTSGSTAEALDGASAPSAADVADAVWDELVTGHDGAGKAGQQLWTDVDAILADTDELQTDDTPAAIAALPTAVENRTEMDSNSTKLSDIVADTNELQVDDVPGLIGALNDISTTEVNTEVDSALSDIHLDHLLATDYDPTAKPGTATALLNELVESDVGVSRFTANALEEAPGEAITDIINVAPTIPLSIDLGGTLPIRVGLMLTNALGDLPSAAEITPGTVSIGYKPIGGSSWTFPVSAQACSEADGLIYYNEIFDSAAGYSEGDTISILFQNQKVTVNSHDYELMGSTGTRFYTSIRQTVPTTTDINTEIDSALSDIHLDHLLAVDYNPAAKPGVATALLNELVQDDAGESQFTVNALEQGPSGTGASAAVIADAVWDESLAGHTIDNSTGEALGSTEADAASALNYCISIVADTDELQQDDVPGLIGALNDISTTEVNTEVDSALADIHLDHLLATDYDPASKPGIATALLNELVESDVGVSRFTANALEEAPAGGASAADIADAVWDEAATGHTEAGKAGQQLWTDVDAILADTNELQTDDTPAAIAALPTAVENRTEMDSNSTKLSDIVADTNELQVDDVPGLIGALNDVSTTDVNTEVDSALSDIHLDHLLAVEYDPASQPGSATALLNELIESDAGISRFTANALEEAPAGGASAADIADAVWDEAATGHTEAGKAGQQLWTDIDAILADTDELQTDDTPAALAALPTAVENRTEMDSNSTKLSDIVADTNELQVDDVPGLIAALNDPTLDNIADAVWDESLAGHTIDNSTGEALGSTEADAASALNYCISIVADTDELQQDDVPGLIGALNDISTTEVNTEVDSALADIHLDHLLATDYDPASKPGIATALLNELVESDVGVSRFTANSLEEAPTGGSAPTVGEIADAVWDEAATGHTDAGKAGEQLWTDVDAILADTNELQTDDTPAAIAALPTAAENRTEMDDNSTKLSDIVADTNELQVDDIPGLIGALNDVSTTEVNTEVDSALADIHLDHLLATDYDPASKPGNATALLNELVESDVGVSRFTANSLEEAPTGGSAPTVGEIADAVWDEASTGHTDAGKAGEQLWTDLDAILVDTDELQTDDTPAAIAALPTAVENRTEMDDNSTKLSDIVADTNELQVDDVPGLIGALNDVSTTEVNTEVDSALADIHLDHLLATDYDPASKPGNATALLNELVESDVGVSRFTANALEEAPSGGASVGDIADAVWDESLAGHTIDNSTGEALGSTEADAAATLGYSIAIVSDTNELQLDDVPGLIAALNDPTAGAIADQVWEEALADHSGTSGSTAEALSQIPGAIKGAIEYTYTIDDGSNPIDGAEVWITTDSGGNNVIWSGVSDALGVARASDDEKPWLDAGTYYGWAQKSGYSFSNPDTLSVS